MKKIVTMLVVAGVLSVVGQGAWALQCKGRIIKEGDPQPRVLSLCGEPSYIYSYEKEITQNRYDPRNHARVLNVVRTIYVDEWTYNFGSTRLIHVLVFHNGRLFDIDTEGRGFTD